MAPYLRDAPRPSRLSRPAPPDAGCSGFVQLLRAVLRDLGRGVERRARRCAVGARRQLQRAGQPPDVEGFRAEQVVSGHRRRAWGALLVAACCGRVAAAPWCRWSSLVVSSASGGGIAARDQMLSRAANAARGSGSCTSSPPWQSCWPSRSEPGRGGRRARAGLPAVAGGAVRRAAARAWPTHAPAPTCPRRWRDWPAAPAS